MNSRKETKSDLKPNKRSTPSRQHQLDLADLQWRYNHLECPSACLQTETTLLSSVARNSQNA